MAEARATRLHLQCVNDEAKPTESRDANVPPAANAASGRAPGDFPDAADVVTPPSPEELMASIPEPMPPAGVSSAPASSRRWLLPRRGASRTPQGLMLLWCLWLLATWAIAIVGNTGLPPIRWMILSAMLGLMLAWPLLRLMQDASPEQGPVRSPGDASREPAPLSRRPWSVMRQILRDWLALVLVFQVVVWPLRLTAMWSIGQALVLDGSVAAWSLLAGAIVAWGCTGERPARRTVAMIVIVLLLFGEPLAMAAINAQASRGQGFVWPMRVSPIETVWTATAPASDWIGGPWVERTIAAGVAAVLTWVALAVSLLIARRGESPAMTGENP